MAVYEVFDPSPYAEEEVPSDIAVEHDVPESLMEGRAGASVSRTVQGFRIQVLNTLSKREADQEVEEILVWWREQDREGGLFSRRGTPPVYTIYRQPYYRVRIGDFVSREEAQRALDAIKSKFPGALIVPDTVTTTR